MPSSSLPAEKSLLAEKLLKNLVHELRQPLGAIETSAYLLTRILGATDAQVYQHLNTIEQQVDVASRILNEAALELTVPGAHDADEENLELTKPATAAVT